MADTPFGAMLDTAGSLQAIQSQRTLDQARMAEAEAKQAEAQAKIDRQMQFGQAFQSAFADGADPYTEVPKIMMQFPDQAENIAKGWNAYQGAEKQQAFNTVTGTLGRLRSGDLQGAQQLIQQSPQIFRGVPPAILQDPRKLEAALLVQTAALGKEGQDFLTTIGATPSAQLEQRKQITAEQKMAFDQKLDLRKLALQERGVQVDEQKLMIDLQKAQNPELSAGLQKLVDDSVTNSVSSAGTANQMRALASQVKQANWTGGSATQFNEFVKGIFGGEDAQSRLITQIEGVLSKEVLSNLPPGPATDKDVALARKAVMKATANPQELSQALEAASRLQDKAAVIQQAKADYISENGGLGKAKRDIVLSDGLTIPAGTAYSDVLKYAGKNASVIWENHPRLGRVTELDIESTMKQSKKSRQQVIDMLSQVARSTQQRQPAQPAPRIPD